MIISSYRLLRPGKAEGVAPYAGLNISDSFTNLRMSDGRHRSCECMGAILDAWYLCTGQVVLGIAVGGAAFTAARRKRVCGHSALGRRERYICAVDLVDLHGQ